LTLLSRVYRKSNELQQEYGEFNHLGEDAVLTTLAVLDFYKQWSIIKRIGKVPISRIREGRDAADLIIEDLTEVFGKK